MTALLFCIIAFVVTYAAGRRSLVAGLLCIIAIGYVYGIVRANYPTTFSHFIFDAGVLGLYLTHLLRPLSPWQKERVKGLMPWLAVLCIWPVMLLLVPRQDFFVQLVGLRASIFLLPFLLFGARLTSDQWRQLAVGVAVLNIAVLGVGIAEFMFGVQRFFPRNAVTEIIYKSNDVLASLGIMTAFRIPGTFSSAHAYAGTMTVVIPLLLGGWVREKSWGPARTVLLLGIVASIAGVFLTAVRSHLVVMALAVLVFLFFVEMRPAFRLTFILMLIGVGWGVMQDPRFQRIMSLTQSGAISDRLVGSLNTSIINVAIEYPLGNGLGGGGTSLPYFLVQRLRDPVVLENEYARIILELGLPGLLIWVSFIVWIMTRLRAPRDDPWQASRRIAWVTTGAFFGTGLLGLGMLTSIPQSAIFLLLAGWIAAPPQLPPRAGRLTPQSTSLAPAESVS